MKKKLLFILWLFSCECYSQTFFAANGFSLFVCADGTAKSCGHNQYGELGDTNTAPFRVLPFQLTSISGVRSATQAFNYSLFLKNDSTVWGGGANNYGQLGSGNYVSTNVPVPIAGLNNIIAVSAGGGGTGGFSLFLKNDGTVWGCGYNSNGQINWGNVPAQINGLSNVIAICAACDHAIFLKSDSTVWACGSNNYGQLGNGTYTNSSTPAQIPGLTGIVAIASKGYHNLFLKYDGTVWGCGYNGSGTLGNGNINNCPSVIQIPGLTGVIKIAANSNYSHFVKNDGSVWACGDNIEGQLGCSCSSIVTVPTLVDSISNIVDVIDGYLHAFFIKNDNTVWGCGYNANGALGDGTVAARYTPIQITSLSNFRQIEACTSSIMIGNDGSVWVFGSETTPLLDGRDTKTNWPAVVDGITGVKSVVGAVEHSIFIMNDGTVQSCGENKGLYGVTSSVEPFRLTPGPVTGLSGIIAAAAGEDYSMFLKNDGTVWGTPGGNGELGNPITTYPYSQSAISGVKAISSKVAHSLFLKYDGTVWACGSNYYGELGTGDTLGRTLPVQVIGISDIVAISAGEAHSLFLKNDGTVWTCGWNGYGELGDGTTIRRTIPIQIPGLTGIIAIEAGYSTSFFLKSDSTVMACGSNGNGQLGDGTNTNRLTPVPISGLTQIIAISGAWHSLFLKSDSTVWACGGNSGGALGDSSYINRNVPVLVRNLCSIPSPHPYMPHYIRGVIYNDQSNDCARQINERGLELPIVATPGNLYSFSNDSGGYYLRANDSVNYSVSPIIPQYLSYLVSDPCPSSYPVFLTTANSMDTTGFNFGMNASLCYALRISMGGTGKRRCFRNLTNITYWNEGLISADSIQIHVKFNQYDIPVGTSLPYTIDLSDSSLVFNVGTLQSLDGGNIIIIDSVACLPISQGLTACSEAWILPVNQCYIDSTTGTNWDHSSVSVSATCVNDTCRFVIHNEGTGNMASANPYRVYADNILVSTNSFQLQSGDSLVILWVSGGATIRLEADQSQGHPGHSHPRATLEACGTDGTGNFTTGQVNLAPMDEDINRVTYCVQISGSHDPNEKVNAPEGVTAAHNVLPNTPIDFTIHFQNTGTDTAFKVVVIDSLSNDLDLATLELGAGSHPYSTSLSGQGVAVLKFTFNNINLPDSTTDELNSSGFIKYKITPKASTPLGTRINNAADIYFDYNIPVRTNTAFVTLGNYLELSTNDSRITKAGTIIFYPNPTSSSITLESSSNNLLDRVIISEMDGRVIKSLLISHAEKTTVDLKELSAGIYFLDCVGDKGSQKIKVVKY